MDAPPAQQMEVGSDAASVHAEEDASSAVGGGTSSDTDERLCPHCGALLGEGVDLDDCDGDSTSESEEVEAALEPATPVKKAAPKKEPATPAKPKERKPRTSPKAMKKPAVRVAARVAMLAAIPGITPTVAKKIVKKWSTFQGIVDAGESKVARLKVGKEACVNTLRAQAILWALGEE